MSITFQTGSYDAASDFTTATISNATLNGAGSFSEELTDLISGGYILDGMTVSNTGGSGSMYIAFLHAKYREKYNR